MATLLSVTITAAVTAVVTNAMSLRDLPSHLTLQGNFTYGSGGTTAKAWVQTSIDNGATWCDIALFSYTTSSARSVINLSAITAVTTPVVPTDGTMSSPAFIDGVIGQLLRVKLTSTGTYAGGTIIQIDAVTPRIYS